MGVQLIDQTTAAYDVGDLDKIAHALTAQAKVCASAWRVKPITVSTHHHASWVQARLVDAIPDTPGALAFHDVERDVPYILLDVGEVLRVREALSAVLSHEVLEYLIDPRCQQWDYSGPRGAFIAHEVGDPVQAYSYDQDGVEVSNFVLPAWFDDQATSGPYDLSGVLHRPWQIGSGGYLIQAKAGAESEVFGETPPASDRIDARRAGRSRSFWRKIQAARMFGL